MLAIQMVECAKNESTWITMRCLNVCLMLLIGLKRCRWRHYQHVLAKIVKVVTLLAEMKVEKELRRSVAVSQNNGALLTM